MDSARAQYGGDLKKSTQKQLERRIQETTDTVVTREYGDYTIRDHQLAKEREIESRRHSNPEPQWRRSRKLMKSMPQGVSRATVIWSTTSAGNSISDETVKKGCGNHRRNGRNRKAECGKGFYRGQASVTICAVSLVRSPAFLMAYGDENTTLANFDALVPDEVFWGGHRQSAEWAGRDA